MAQTPPPASPTLRGSQPPSEGEAIGCALPIVDGAQAQRTLDEDVQCEPLPNGYRVEEYVSGLRRPVAMAFAPDGRAFITEQHTGDVRVVINGELLPTPFASMERLYVSHEGGLLGITVDPAFKRNHYVYVLYNSVELFPEEIVTKVVRYTEVGNVGMEPTIIYDDLPGPENEIHTAGNLHFGPDGKLYISLGDFRRPGDAPDLEKLGGKILRVNPDGSAPSDNPFVQRDDADPRVYASGLRNPFDFDFHPVTGMMIATENGLDDDEINRIEAGGDYGWPDATGPNGDPDKIDPVIYYEDTRGPAGASFYSGDRLAAYTNAFFFCQYHSGGLLHHVTFNDLGDVVSDALISGGCTSDVAEGPDGLLYFIDLVSGTVHRITRDTAP